MMFGSPFPRTWNQARPQVGEDGPFFSSWLKPMPTAFRHFWIAG